MKDALARRVLADLLGWGPEQLTEHSALLQTMASLKYDGYGQYSPGAKFAENLAVWLRQFEDDADRQTALDFVETELLFLTEREINHIIEIAYPDVVARAQDKRVAEARGLKPWQVAAIRRSPEYQGARRRTLYLGLSDGARLGRFRRSSPQLSHEQFAQEYQVAPDVVAEMSKDLEKALGKIDGYEGDTGFDRVWLIDDFSGSGRSLIRFDEKSERFKGKLAKFADRLETLQTEELLPDDATVDVLLYIASAQAMSHVTETLQERDLGHWQLHVVYELPEGIKIAPDSPFGDLCERYYDEETTDDIKGRVPLGYESCALPLVLSHNTPNNSASLLWAETKALNRRALFPRYERHHPDRT